MTTGHAPTPLTLLEKEARRVARLRADQRVVAGLLAGLGAAAAGAALWAWVAVQLGVLWGATALGVGAAVGFAVRWAGRGVHPGFGGIAACCALLGCVVGNACAMTFLWAAQAPEALSSAITGWQLLADPARVAALARQNFDAMHLVFYAVAAIEGYWLAFERIRAPRAALAADVDG